MRIPFVSGRVRDKVEPVSGLEIRVPAWIDQVPRVGWPIVAVIAMVMCAPGEHHLAVMAGYTDKVSIFGLARVELAWGMPACLVAYAGIAASVATRRAKGAPGRKTAVLGAFLSLGAAMTAQPVSHMFVTGHWSSQPSPEWIVWTVSVVPPLVVGHLMHMAASHTVSRRTRTAAPDSTPASVPAGQTDKAVPVPSGTAEGETRRVVPDKLRTAVVSRPAVSLDKDTRPVLAADTDSGQPDESAVPSLADKQNLSARARVLAQDGHDVETIKDKLRKEFPGAKADAVRKAAGRAVDRVSAAS